MRILGIVVSTLIITGTAFASDADARERRTHAVVQTERGVYTTDSRVERLRGSRTRDATVTGPNGRQSSVYDQRQWNAADGVYSHDRSRVYANGDTRTVDTDANRVAPGAWNFERDVTGRNGNTRTQTGTVTVERNP